MIESLFIANRGEIAVRIIRACKELGIRTVIGYSVADKNSLPVCMADEKVCIGSAAPSDSYLNIENIISAASGHRCEAIHPGVGFLSERHGFADEVLKAGMEFVGPRPASIKLMGDKISAKRVAVEAGVPVIAGTQNVIDDIREAKKFAQEVEYPIILKASAGGGGRGMRIVNSEQELEASMEITMTEASKAFGDGRIYLEKYLAHPRHVEFQLIADKQGNVVHLGERDCTVQYRHQKIIEESPSPAIDDKIRVEMGNTSVNLLKHIGYENVATVEYLFDGKNYYFMEVNSRIQVEHPVTELVTGVDLIKEQIRISSGESLKFTQDDIHMNGYAMECRINAITPGTIEYLHIPGGRGVRVDTWINQGAKIPPFYDALLLKLLVHAENRNMGISAMLCALDELEIRGPGLSYNKHWHTTILHNSTFRSGKYSIQYLEDTKLIEDLK